MNGEFVAALIAGMRDLDPTTGTIISLLACLSIAVVLAKNILHVAMFAGAVNERSRKAGIERLTEARKCDSLTELERTCVGDELATEHFRLATGIGRGKAFREVLIRAHKDAKGALTFTHFQLALPYLQIRDGALVAELSRWHIAGYRIARWWAIGLLASGLVFLFLAAARYLVVDGWQYLGSIGAGLLCGVAAILVLYQVSPVAAAIRVRDVLAAAKRN